MTNLERYHDAMSQYLGGKFGEEYLTIGEILKRAGEPTLLQDMTAEELESLMNETSAPMLKALFSRLRDSRASCNMPPDGT